MATTFMSLTLPTEDGDSGVWDTTLNTALTAIDAHDHTSGNGQQVPAAGLNINADLGLGNNSLTAAKSLGFTAQSSLSGFTLRLAVKTDNELYWTTSGGTEVKLTDGVGINTTLVGGITGDYASTDADVDYSDSLKTYRFYQDDSPATWAKLASEEHEIYPAGTGTNSVNLQAPSGLSADYDFILPTGLPGSGDEILTIDSSGQVVQGGEVSAYSVKSGEHITLQGTGRLKHSTLKLNVHAASSAFPVGSGSYVGPYASFGSADVVDLGIPLVQEKRLTVVDVTHYKTAAGSTAITIRKVDSAGTESTLATFNRTSTTGWAKFSLDLTDDTVGDEEYFFVRVTGSSAGERLLGAIANYDHV